MEKILAKLTEKYHGWTLVSLTTHPSTTPGTAQAVVVTLTSPAKGDSATTTKTVTIGNVEAGDISEGE